MSYRIENYNFVRWIGPTPPLVKQHVVAFNKIGQAGLSAQLTGIHGDEFEVELWADFANQAAAQTAEEAYRDLIGTTTTLLYHSVNYEFVHQHKYLVMGIDTIDMRAHVLLMSPTYTYFSGWRVRTRWRMIPVVI